jgi:uridine kinase
VRIVKATEVIVLEGILIFENPEILNRLDIKIFVDTDADVRIIRRIKRDVSERGRSLDSVISQYISTVKPMHEAFVEPSKRHADIIVPEGGMNRVAIEMITQRIISHVERKE